MGIVQDAHHNVGVVTRAAIDGTSGGDNGSTAAPRAAAGLTEPIAVRGRRSTVTPHELNAAFDSFQVDLDAHPELGGFGPDFWLFDAGEPNEFAIIMRYEAGSVRGYERTTDVGWCRDQHDKAIARSASLAEYLARTPRAQRSLAGSNSARSSSTSAGSRGCPATRCRHARDQPVDDLRVEGRQGPTVLRRSPRLGGRNRRRQTGHGLGCLRWSTPRCELIPRIQFQFRTVFISFRASEQGTYNLFDTNAGNAVR